VVSITSGNLVYRYECTLNEEKAAEKRDEIKKGFDDLKKELADFTGKRNTKKNGSHFKVLVNIQHKFH